MPTPRPSITAMIVVKSGIVTRFESMPTSATPRRCRRRAMPMGRPMASTEPKARMRMTMAKPRPSTSDSGGSNSASTGPPSSTRSPSTSGHVEDLGADLGARSGRGRSAGGPWRRRAGRRGPAGDLLGASAYGLDDVDALDLVDGGEQLRHRRLHLGVVDALLGGEDDRAAEAAALALEVGVQHVDALAAVARGDLEGAVVARPDDAAEGTERDEGDDPCGHDALAMVVAELAEAAEHARRPSYPWSDGAVA